MKTSAIDELEYADKIIDKLTAEIEQLRADNAKLRAEIEEGVRILSGHVDIITELRAERDEALDALKQSLDGHYATWMAARSEVEGARASAALFEKEPEVITARAVIAKANASEAAGPPAADGA